MSRSFKYFNVIICVMINFFLQNVTFQFLLAFSENIFNSFFLADPQKVENSVIDYNDSHLAKVAERNYTSGSENQKVAMRSGSRSEIPASWAKWLRNRKSGCENRKVAERMTSTFPVSEGMFHKDYFLMRLK